VTRLLEPQPGAEPIEDRPGLLERFPGFCPALRAALDGTLGEQRPADLERFVQSLASGESIADGAPSAG
jgi:hypothetical protein